VDIEVRALLGRGGSLPEAMVELSLTCATVGGVVACGIRGGAGSRCELGQGEDGTRGRGQRWARRRLHPRASPASGEVEICAQGPVCSSVVLCVPSGMVGGVHAQWRMRNHVVAPGRDPCLVATMLLCLCVG
jgi:hypothetical protein